MCVACQIPQRNSDGFDQEGYNREGRTKGEVMGEDSPTYKLAADQDAAQAEPGPAGDAQQPQAVGSTDPIVSEYKGNDDDVVITVVDNSDEQHDEKLQVNADADAGDNNSGKSKHALDKHTRPQRDTELSNDQAANTNEQAGGNKVIIIIKDT